MEVEVDNVDNQGKHKYLSIVFTSTKVHDEMLYYTVGRTHLRALKDFLQTEPYANASRTGVKNDAAIYWLSISIVGIGNRILTNEGNASVLAADDNLFHNNFYCRRQPPYT